MEVASLEAQLADARQELAAAHVQISELQKQLATANDQLATFKKERDLQQNNEASANAGADHGPPPKRNSIVIPEWLNSAPVLSTDVTDPTVLPEGPQPANPLRFTADQMPDWLLRASTDVLEGLDEDEDEEPECYPLQSSSSRWAATSSHHGDSAGGVSGDSADGVSGDCADGVSILRSAAHVEARVVAHTFVRGHIEHEVRVSIDDTSWVVRRRYREFRAMREALASSLTQASAPRDSVQDDATQAGELDAAAAPPLAPFAVPKLLLHTPAALRQREKLLEELLESCIRAAKLPCPSNATGTAALRPLEAFFGIR
jgi:hypothetical protein